jgi:hypothetical protein
MKQNEEIPMLRKTLNASPLQEEVSRRLHKLQEVIDDGVKFVVPRPQHQPPDRTGCNWTMKHFGNAAGFEASIAGVLARVQAEYNLAAQGEEEEADEEPERTGDPFGGSKPAGSANPFGDAGGPAKASNPFGDAKTTKAGDPFGAKESATPAPKRPGNPFGDE